MARVNPSLQTFNRGRVSKLGLARVDVDRTRLSAEKQTNFVPRTLGSMMLRPGLEYIGTIRNSSTAILIPFIFNNVETALVEVTSTAARIWGPSTVPNSGIDILTRANSTAAVTNGTFDSDLTGWTDADESGSTSEWFTGGYMSLIGTRYARAIRRQQITSTSGAHGLKTVINRGRVVFKVGSSAGGDDYFGEAILRPGNYSFEINSTGDFHVEFSANTEYRSLVDSISVESSGDVVLDSTWASSDLSLLRWDQSADVVFTGAFGYPQKRIERYSTASWGMAEYDPLDGPFRVPNTTTKRLTPSALSGDITLSCDQPLFNSGHVGALFRITSIGQSASITVSGADQWSDPIRVSGITETRIFDILITGTFSATVRVQRSVGEVGSWVNVSGLSWTSTQDTSHDDGLDNQIIFYRIGVGSTYTSGSPVATLTYASGGITGVAKINSVIGSTESSARVLKNLGSTQATETWEEGDWSTFRGFPGAVGLHEGRLWWAGKSKIWGSVSDAFESFDPGVEGDSGPINRSIGTGPVDSVEWIASVGRLIVGTDSREMQAKTGSLDDPLTPSNFNLKDVSGQGSASIQALKIDNRILFAQRSGVRVMDLNFDGGTLDYRTQDRTLLIPEIGEPGIARMAVQRQPDTRVHCVRSATDGTVGMLISDPSEDVSAWIDIESSGGVNGIIEEVAVLPGPGEDQVFYIVKREINGSTKRYLERWASEWDARGGAQSAKTIFQITGGSAGDTITSVKVNGTESLGDSVAFTDTTTATAALLVDILNGGWNLGDVTAAGSFVVGNQAVGALAVAVSDDGAKLYVGNDNAGTEQAVYEFDLSTKWDVTTAVYNDSKLDVSSEIAAADTFDVLVFGNDGKKMYLAGPTGLATAAVYQYTLGTAWDITTASYDNVSLTGMGTAIGETGGSMQSFNFHPDGTKAYVQWFGPAALYEFTLTIPWDLSTATYSGKSLNVSAQVTSPNQIFWRDDGTNLYVLDFITTNTIYQYDVSPAFNLSGVTYDGVSFDIDAAIGALTPWNFTMSRAGTRLYIMVAGTGSATDAVYQFVVGGTSTYLFSAVNNAVTVTAPTAGSSDNGVPVEITSSIQIDGSTGEKTFLNLSGGRSGFSPFRSAAADNRMADSFLTQESTATTVVSGLDHLVGSSVVAWGAGKDLGTYTVSSTGTVTLSESATSAMVGLPYSGLYKSAKLAYGVENGSALTQAKRVNHLGLVMADVHARGIQYGPSTDTLDPMPAVEEGTIVSTDLVHDVYDHASIEFPGNWDTDSRIILKGAAPRPVTVLGAVIQMETKSKT